MYVLIILTIWMFFFGVVFLGVAIWFNRMVNKKKAVCTKPMKALVTSIERVDNVSSDGIRTTSWYPVYKYVIGDLVYEKRSFMGSPSQDFTVGEMVTIYINPNNPNEFYCPKERVSTIRKIFFFLGGLFIILGITALIILIRMGFQL